MEPSSSTSSSEQQVWLGARFRAVTIGICILLAATVAIQTGLKARQPEYENLEGAVYRVQLELAARATEDSFVLGDSRGLRSVDPLLLESELDDGSRWRNLSMNGLPPLGAYLLLRRLVEQGTDVRRVVYVLTPYLLSRDDILSGMFLPLFPLELSEVGTLIAAPLRREQRYRWTCASIFPALRLQHRLRVELERHIGVRTGRRGKRILEEIERTRSMLPRSRGFVPKTWGMGPKAIARERRKWERMHFEVLDIHQQYIDAIAAFAEKSAIELHLVTPPVPEDLNKARTRSGFNRGFELWLATMAQEFPAVGIKESTIRGYSRERFADPGHLRGSGAAAYTRETAEYLARWAASGRPSP